LELGVRGSATNLDDGRVKVEAEGPEEAVRGLLGRLKEQPSATGRPGRVSEVNERWSDASGRYAGFREA
jgi:acylphosphatase